MQTTCRNCGMCGIFNLPETVSIFEIDAKSFASFVIVREEEQVTKLMNYVVVENR